MKRLVLTSLLFASTAMTAQQHLVIDDLLDARETREAGGLLSPDGTTFAGTEQGQIMLRAVDGGASKQLTWSPAAKSELSWSSDGRSLAYISEGDVWTVGIEQAKETRLTHDPSGPGDPRGASDHHPLWNPRGTWVLYQSGRNGFNELYAVRADGSGEHRLAATEIYSGADVIAAADARGSTPDHGDAVSSDRFDPNPSWSPDGKSIVYTERSRRHFSGRLTLLPFDPAQGTAGQAHVLYTAANDPGGAWAVNTAAWLPDSHALVLVLQESHWDKLWLIDARGGKPRPLTTGTGEDEDPVVSPDGRSVAFLSNRDLAEEQHLWVVPVSGGVPRRLTALSGIESRPQWTPDSKSVFFLRGSSLQSPAPYRVGVAGHEPALPLSPEGLSKFARLGILPEVAHFRSGDGTPLAGILYKPAQFDAKHRYPAVIIAHGGPEGQTALSLSPWSLFLADHGFVVLEPNFRGSTGYGERFRNSNVEDSGGGEIDDIAASAKYLVVTGAADPARIAIMGGSHGGTVTANAVAKLPATFAAGIEMFGVVDRALFLQYTNRNSAIRWETKMGGTPEKKPAVYRKANVLLEVNAIRTPLLVLHGEQDPQVPPQESKEFVAALSAQGKVFEYHTYPGEGHGFRQRDHRKDAYERELAFLNRYLLQAPR